MTTMTPEDQAWLQIKRVNHQRHDDECEVCRLLAMLDAATAGKPAGEMVTRNPAPDAAVPAVPTGRYSEHTISSDQPMFGAAQGTYAAVFRRAEAAEAEVAASRAALTAAEGALQSALGYMTNAMVDLETGAPKRTALATIKGGMSIVRAALRPATTQAKEIAMDKQPTDMTDAFLAALTELSMKYGIAITGKPQLFVMEREDYASTYRIDDESSLSLG